MKTVTTILAFLLCVQWCLAIPAEDSDINTADEDISVSDVSNDFDDEIAYLIEQARNNDKWAYQSLGERYHYCKRGVERSIMNAMAYYGSAYEDTKLDSLVVQFIMEQPDDYLSLTAMLYEPLEKGDTESVTAILNKIETEGYLDVSNIRKIISSEDPEYISQLSESILKTPGISVDEAGFTFLATQCALKHTTLSSAERSQFPLKNAELLGVHYPLIYNEIAINFLERTHEDMEPAAFGQEKLKRISQLEKADEKAMLAPRGARCLFNHYLTEMKNGKMDYDIDNLKRLAAVARLDAADVIDAVLND